MSEIKIHIFHIGKVCVAPELPLSFDVSACGKAKPSAAPSTVTRTEPSACWCVSSRATM